MSAYDKIAPRGIRTPDASLSLRIAGFVGDSIVDGPGLRCVIFAQGCPHACPGCQNPASWDFSAGEDVTVQDLLARVRQYPMCRGVTFSGGEPFCQPLPFIALADRLRSESYELAAYTGYTFEELLAGTDEQKQLLARLDTLVDGRFVKAERSLSLPFRGSANQRILHVPHSLEAGNPIPENHPRWTGAIAP